MQIMMKEKDEPIKILHLEDNLSDSLIVKLWLKKENINFEYYFSDNEIDFKDHLDNQKIDIILSDYNLPDYSGSEALLLVKNNYQHIPFVFVSGTMGEEAAIESLLNGATDYVLKNRLVRLGPAVRRTLRESRLQQEYRKAIDTLRQKEEQYRTLIEGMNEGIMLVDIDDTILFVNQQTCDITKYCENELIGKKCHEILYDTANQKTIQEKNYLRKKGIKDTYEIELLRKDREKIWIRFSASPVYDETGKITGSIGVFENIDDRKIAEEERNKLTRELIFAKEKAEESDRLKSAFLANISHEIRTPMNGILGFAELLKSREITPDAKDRYIHIIEQSGTRMLNIINDIVDISKIEAGQMNVQIQETNVNQLLRDLLIFFTPEAKTKGLKLSFSTSLNDSQSNIMTDHTKLTQILTNMIKNALKFTKSGSIEFGYTVEKGQNAVESRHTLYLQFFVKDTGVGIPADQTVMIFERFRQGSVSLTRAYEGAGLGLSISKAFVEMLEGNIWVESKPEKGSVFYFSIPFKQPTPEIGENFNLIRSEEDSPSIHILIVEDDETSMLYVKALLENEDVTVLEAANGKEAIELVKNHPKIDLVLMDMKMPEMDGFETTRLIKQLRPTLPVIAQTAYAFVEDQEKAIQAGCDAYISKPIKKQALLEKILNLM